MEAQIYFSKKLSQLGKTSELKKRFLSGIARITEPPHPPHDPNSGNLVLFFLHQKRCFARMTGKKIDAVNEGCNDNYDDNYDKND